LRIDGLRADLARRTKARGDLTDGRIGLVTANARSEIHAHELNLVAKLSQCRQQAPLDQRAFVVSGRTRQHEW
jgi:hypothetical protein